MRAVVWWSVAECACDWPSWRGRSPPAGRVRCPTARRQQHVGRRGRGSGQTARAGQDLSTSPMVVTWLPALSRRREDSVEMHVRLSLRCRVGRRSRARGRPRRRLTATTTGTSPATTCSSPRPGARPRTSSRRVPAAPAPARRRLRAPRRFRRALALKRAPLWPHAVAPRTLAPCASPRGGKDGVLGGRWMVAHITAGLQPGRGAHGVWQQPLRVGLDQQEARVGDPAGRRRPAATRGASFTSAPQAWPGGAQRGVPCAPTHYPSWCRLPHVWRGTGRLLDAGRG